MNEIIYIALYLGFIGAAVVYASFKLSREGFLLADRSLPPSLAAVSLAVSKFGGGLILAYGALVYLFGMGALWFYAGFALGYILFLPFARRLKKQSDDHQFYTIADYYKHKAGDNAGFIVALLSAYTMLGFTCINLVGGAQILGQITDLPYMYAVLFVSVFIGAYVILGGFKSVIITDFAQGLIIVSGLIVFLAFSSVSLDGLSFDGFVPAIKNPPIAYLFIFGFLLPFGMPEVWPRIYAIAKPEYLTRTLVLTVFVYIGLGVLLTLLILSFRDLYPDMPPPKAILTGFQSVLPPSLAGLVAIFLFAAVMSSADTYLFQASSALEQDLHLSRYIKLPSDKTRLDMRLNILIILVLSVGVAFMLPDIVKVVLVFTAGNFILGVFGLVSRFKDLRYPSLLSGTVLGMIAIVIAIIIHGVNFYVPLYGCAGTVVGLLGALVFRNKSLPS